MRVMRVRLKGYACVRVIIRRVRVRYISGPWQGTVSAVMARTTVQRGSGLSVSFHERIGLGLHPTGAGLNAKP